MRIRNRILAGCLAVGALVVAAPPANADTVRASWGHITGHYTGGYSPMITGTVFDDKYDGACVDVYVDFGTGYTRNAYIAGGHACGVNTGATYSITNAYAATHTYGIREYLVYKGTRSRYATLCSGDCKSMN